MIKSIKKDDIQASLINSLQRQVADLNKKVEGIPYELNKGADSKTELEDDVPKTFILPSGAVIDEFGNLISIPSNALSIASDSASDILEASEILTKLAPSVVLIETTGGSGSGFIIAHGNGKFVVTNAHVLNEKDLNGYIIKRYSSAKLVFSDGISVTGTVLGRDEIIDLAVLSTGNTDLKAALIGSSDESFLKIGSDVFTLGYPKKLSNLTFTKGILSSVQFIENNLLLQIDAAINPGNSGGPLVNNKGEVIGINVLKLNDAEAIGFAIPINTAKELIPYLIGGLNNLIFNPAPGSNISISQTMVALIGLNPSLTCEQLGYLGNNLKICNLYRNNQSAYHWTIEDQ